jgi:hypothetical protein
MLEKFQTQFLKDKMLQSEINNKNKDLVEQKRRQIKQVKEEFPSLLSSELSDSK